MGQDTKLDLWVICWQNGAPGFCYEGLSDFPSLGRAYGDVLQIGIAAAQPSRGGNGLIVWGVNTSGDRINQIGQGIYIGWFEFADTPVPQDFGG